jgi:hypothetical protein
MSDRELSLLKGEDLKPLTRREMYIRALYNKAQKVPTPKTREEIAFSIAIANLRRGENENE